MLNEFRQDPVSGDWVLFATARGNKPQPKDAKLFQTIDECPFEPQRLHEQEHPVAIYHNGQPVQDLSQDWTVVVFPNKYPSVSQTPPPVSHFSLSPPVSGKGFHELVVTRDHEKHFGTFTKEEVAEIISVYADRYRFVAAQEEVKCVFIFHNHGHFAGASIYHNHSQILSMPLIPSGILNHLNRSEDYFNKNGASIYDTILSAEREEKQRIVFENEKFIVLCPYVSRSAYEMRIFPKIRSPYFGEIKTEDIMSLAEALQTALQKLNKALDNPDYTFFIHSAMNTNSQYAAYHWHIEIMPRFSIVAGQEFGTNVFVNTVDPDEAAALLRDTVI